MVVNTKYFKQHSFRMLPETFDCVWLIVCGLLLHQNYKLILLHTVKHVFLLHLTFAILECQNFAAF